MKKLFLLLITVVVAGSLFYFLYWSPVYRLKPMHLIPMDAAFVMGSSQPLKSWKAISESSVWQHLKQNPGFKKITNNANHLDSIFRTNEWLDFLGNKELLIAAHPVQDTYDYLYVMDLARVSYLQDIKYYLQRLLDKGFRVTHRTYSGVEITELYNIKEKETLYLSFIENLAVMSPTSKLTEAAIKQYKKPVSKDIYFLEITDELGFQGLIRVYINFEGFFSYLAQYTKDNASMDLLKQTLRYAGFKLTMEDDALSFNGYLNINDTVNSYLRALYAGGEGSHDFLEVVPSYSPYFIALGFKNFSTFIENLEQALDNNPEQKKSYLENRHLMENFLNINLDETFINWVDNEVVMLQTSPTTKTGIETYALLLKATDPALAKAGLDRIRRQIRKKTPVKITSVGYKGYSIHYMAVKGFFKVFLGKLFDKFDKPYYSIVGDWVVFSNHPRTIKNIIDAIDQENTLFYHEDFLHHYKTLNHETSVYAHVNMPQIFGDLQPLMEAEEWQTMKANDEYIKCFSRLSLQLAPRKNGIFHTRFSTQFKVPSAIESPVQPLPYTVSDQKLPEKVLTWADQYKQALREADKIIIPDLSLNEYITYYDNGNIQYEVGLKDGWKHGRFYSYFANGNLQFKGRYKDDKKDGQWRVYNQDGSLLIKLQYSEGSLVVDR